MNGMPRGVAAPLLLISVSQANAADVMLGPYPSQISLTSTTTLGWHTNNDDSSRSNDDYGELFERFNLTGSTGPWVAGLRLDTATFASAPTPALRDRYTLEKAWLGWSGRSVEMNAGDAYVSFGRGLALSLRKIDELGVDTTVRGAKLLVHEGPFSATLVAGHANIQNVDEASGQSVGDPSDLIGGLQTQLSVGPLTSGFYTTAFAFNDPVTLVPGDAYRDRYYHFGATLDAPRLNEHLGFYLEGIAQIRDIGADAGDHTGVGVYGYGTAYAGPLTLLFEGKMYGELEPVKPYMQEPAFASIAYNNPPTVERVLQVLENPQQRIYGGRLRADWTFSPDLTIYANYGLFLDDVGYSDPDRVGAKQSGVIQDPYAGIEARWQQARSRALLSGGWRHVSLVSSDTTVRGDAHFELDVAIAIGERWSVELHGLHVERKKHESPILDEQFREGNLLVGLRLPYFSASAGYDYTTEPVQPKRDYFNGVLQWDPTPSSSLRFFAGAARGGLKCLSGVCRTFPPFEGVKVVATLRY